MRFASLLLIAAAWSAALLPSPAAGPTAARETRLRTTGPENPAVLEQRFAESVRQRDETTCLEILEALDSSAMEALKGMINVEQKQRHIDLIGYLAGEMLQSFERAAMESATVRDRLEELERCYPRRED